MTSEDTLSAVQSERQGRHIGIVAGTAEGAAMCFRSLFHEADARRKPVAGPQATMHAFPLQAYLRGVDRNDWRAVAALMSESAAILAKAGADLIICPNNTLHRAFEFVVSPIPWLHIAEVVAAEAARRGYRRVGLLGTMAVLQGSFYRSRLWSRGIDLLIPEREDRFRLERIIRSELIAGCFTAKSRACVRQMIEVMAERGADAVILGCTELPLLIPQAEVALPLLDSTTLLALAALEHDVPHTV
ncbi:MAG TPA: amino acid racemase [Nitrospira sp.]|nr:amino acid racemase [Nitrospira sp.]